jgi:hypothetical protein
MVRNQHRYFLITICLLCINACILTSCNNQKENPDTSSQNTSVTRNMVSEANDNLAPQVPAAPAFSSENMDMKTFEVKDSTSGKSLGWGYDIYIDNRKAIHQPILPGVPGNNSFKTEEQAKKTGLFVLDKMKKAGTLVAVSSEDLDKLGITK